MIGDRDLDRERLWASNGFVRFRPRRSRRRAAALAFYWLALCVFFAAGLWALLMD